MTTLPGPDRMNRTELHYAALNSDLTQVRHLLAANADVNAADRAGWTAIHFAAQAQAAHVVAELLIAGAIVDPVDDHGNTPLWRAVFNYRAEPATIQTLVAAGANPQRLNSHGVSPRVLAERIATSDAASLLPPRAATSMP